MQSLLRANLIEEVNLYISCEGNVAEDVLDYVKHIKWSLGKFEIIKQSEQLGVDKHNHACMRMAEKLGSVLVLEDDLVVSPYFGTYLSGCSQIINSESTVAGVGLYRYSIIEQNHFPFNLIPNDEFLYYQQKACSKGTFYTWSMLKPYFEFSESFNGDFQNYHLPENVQKWGDEVWEKSFYCYLQESDKYVAYPRYSLTSDFADFGVHMKKQTLKYVHQSELYLSDQFGSINEFSKTDNIYDAFYEVSPATLQKLNKKLLDYEFEVDLYGHKSLKHIKSECLISSKESSKPIIGWERRLKPEVNNVLLDQQGDFYTLAKTSDFSSNNERGVLKENFLYYFPDTKLMSLLKMKLSEVFSRFIKR
ncbi:MAG: hypothetical protein COA58_00130 [Bacteroidetes bacterium]|nr:MAG: hypothetical protein COA58_00130 [Bacteroidota bacterium]